MMLLPDGTEAHRSKTDAYSEVSILHKIEAVGDFKKLKTWKCINGLHSLPYWDSNLLQYNLDFMHIQKNVCEYIYIYGTILGLEGKSKDNLGARQDLQQMNIRPELHPQKKLQTSFTYLQLLIPCLKKRNNS
jgi:hypothetical protein